MVHWTLQPNASSVIPRQGVSHKVAQNDQFSSNPASPGQLTDLQKRELGYSHYSDWISKLSKAYSQKRLEKGIKQGVMMDK